MYFPKLKAAAQQRAGVEQFGGLDRRPGSGAGSLEQMENLWSSGYPALETRPLRRTVTQLTKPNGMTEKDGLFWVDGTALYVNGAKTGLVLTDSRKQLVSMGAYLLIFPDKKYINTQDLTDFGSMENVRTTTGEVTFTLCDGTGESLGSYAAGTEAPQEPQTGDLWLDTERPESVMRRYDGSAWTALTEVCTKIAAVGVGLGFRAGDGVTVAGCGAAELNGLHVLQAAVAFARWNGEMTVLCSDGRLLDTSGTLGTAETGFSWSAESGDLGLYTPEHKYLSRLELRLKTAAGSTVKAYVCYDGDNVWEQVGGVSGEAGQTRGAVLQVRPRRCGHLRLKLAGDGPCRVYSAAAVYEKGSDGP